MRHFYFLISQIDCLLRPVAVYYSLNAVDARVKVRRERGRCALSSTEFRKGLLFVPYINNMRSQKFAKKVTNI